MTRVPPAVFDKIRSCYAGLGAEVSIRGSGLSYHHCPRWRNATMSPLFVPAPADLEALLPRLESHFSQQKTAHPYEQAAYAVLLGASPAQARAGLPRSAAERGWKVQEKAGTVNFWEKRTAARLPSGFHFASGRYFDARLYRDFRRMMRANFGSTSAFMDELDPMLKAIEPRLQSVIIYHESGRTAGAGLVAGEGAGAFLFCGSVAERFRGKGLWNRLVALRQGVSSERGARYWATSTRVPRIMGKGDRSFPTAILFKDSV